MCELGRKHIQSSYAELKLNPKIIASIKNNGLHTKINKDKLI